MTLTAKIRAWFRKEPKAPVIVKEPTHEELKNKMEQYENQIDMVKRILSGEFIRPQIIPSALKSAIILFDKYEKSKAAYEEALLKELAGLKEGEEK